MASLLGESGPDEGVVVVPVTEDRIARLRNFGLSEYAARTYLALLDLGLTEARDISTLSKVPTSKIYRILEQLHEKGLVIILPEFPKKYAPVPFDEYLEKLRVQHEEAMGAIERDREELAEMFSVAGDVDVGDRGSFTVLRGRRNVLAKIEELIADAERDFLYLGSAGTAARSRFYHDALRKARERNVRTRLILPVPEDAVEQVAKLADCAEIREHDAVPGEDGAHVGIAIVDEHSALVVNFVPDDGNLYQGKDTAFLTDHEAMVASLKALLEPQWARASPFERDPQRRSAAPARDFTRFYATDEDAYAALTEALERGTRHLRAVNRFPPREPRAEVVNAFRYLKATGGAVHALLALPDVEAARAYARLVSEHAIGEFRHVDASPMPRFWILDDREAFFSVTDAVTPVPGGSRALTFHTSNQATVRALRAQFEALWTRGRPLYAHLDDLSGDDGDLPATPSRFLSGDAVREAVRETVHGARSDLRVVADEAFLDAFTDPVALAEAAKRGVRIRALARGRDAAARVVEHLGAVADVRRAHAATPVGVAADASEAVLRLAPSGTATEGGEPHAVHTTDGVHLSAFTGFFDACWEDAPPAIHDPGDTEAGEGSGDRRLIPRAGPRDS